MDILVVYLLPETTLTIHEPFDHCPSFVDDDNSKNHDEVEKGMLHYLREPAYYLVLYNQLPCTVNPWSLINCSGMAYVVPSLHEKEPLFLSPNCDKMGYFLDYFHCLKKEEHLSEVHKITTVVSLYEMETLVKAELIHIEKELTMLKVMIKFFSFLSHFEQKADHDDGKAYSDRNMYLETEYFDLYLKRKKIYSRLSKGMRTDLKLISYSANSEGDQNVLLL